MGIGESTFNENDFRKFGNFIVNQKCPNNFKLVLFDFVSLYNL